MPKRFTERILDFLQRDDYRPMKARRLAQAMGIAEAEYGDFHDAVDSLRRVGRVVLGTQNALMLPPPSRQIAGTFRANPRGFGFVVPDKPTEHGDVFIAPGDAGEAVTGDRVLCQIVDRGRREGKPSFGGRIIEILERGENRYVGRLRLEGGLWFVQPDGNTLHVPILIGDPTAKSARSGDQVVVEIVQYPREGRPARGVIVERIGKAGQPGVDLASIIRQYHLPTEFPTEVLREVRAAAKAFDPNRHLEKREDLTGLLTLTIDPDDAKDFDDAISLQPLRGDRAAKPARGSGRRGAANAAAWELGVHIADVSAFVAVGGPTDVEARERGTSVYLPRHVIPMLPEILSNGLCSLQEGEARLCKSAFIQYDSEGQVIGARFANTVIRSARRLTYRQATDILEGQTAGFTKPVVELVRRMETLARVIQRRREREGMISLELPEVELIMDDEGRVIDARPEDTSYSHTIIEMFMVEANEAVARLLERLAVPFIRRIHPEPDERSLESMARFMRAAGFAVPKKVTPGDLQALLKPLKGKPQSYAVNLAVLKSMETAQYSPRAVGHFALASRCYTHFTSPIRRYADLTIHRLLQLYLDGALREGGRGADRAPSEEELTELALRLSHLSRRAESAEEELKTVKVLELLAKKIGEEYKGVVTGVTNFGIFVQHPKYLIDGLLRLEDLGDDWWEVDLRSARVVGERSRRAYMMGQVINVRIADVDVPARQLKLALASKSDQAAGQPRSGSRTARSREHGRPGGRRGRHEGRRTRSARQRGRRR